MKTSGGHSGITLSWRPKKYARTSQQERIAEAAKYCGIQKGMSRKELTNKMKTCIPEFFKNQTKIAERKEGEGNTSPSLY